MKFSRSESNAFDAPKVHSSIAGLDAVRAGAALLVVMLHACVPYLNHPMPGLIWPVRERGSVLLDGCFWAIEVFIMPLFLIMAGFLMWRSWGKSTPTKLIRSRGKRLLRPLLFAIAIVLPIDLYLWTLGLVHQGIVAPVKLKSFKFDQPIADQIWGLSHLWFLLYVFLYVLLFGVAAATLSRVRMPIRKQPNAAHVRLLLTIIAGTAMIVLVLHPEVVWGFQHAFLPVPSKWIYSGLFFAAGCVLAIIDADFCWLRNASYPMAAIGLVCLGAAVTLGIWSLGQATDGASPSLAAHAVLAIVTVCAAATASLGILGLCIRHVRSTPPWVHYLAAASIWIYLVHHPFLGLIHFDLSVVWPSGSSIVKCMVSFLFSVGLSLATFHVFIRQTALGNWLGMSHAPRSLVSANDHTMKTVVGRVEDQRAGGSDRSGDTAKPSRAA